MQNAKARCANFGFFGVDVGFDIVIFFLDRAELGRFSGRALDQREKVALTIGHEYKPWLVLHGGLHANLVTSRGRSCERPQVTRKDE
jgi:hypothetical protein